MALGVTGSISGLGLTYISATSVTIGPGKCRDKADTGNTAGGGASYLYLAGYVDNL